MWGGYWGLLEPCTTTNDATADRDLPLKAGAYIQPSDVNEDVSRMGSVSTKNG